MNVISIDPSKNKIAYAMWVNDKFISAAIATAEQFPYTLQVMIHGTPLIKPIEAVICESYPGAFPGRAIKSFIELVKMEGFLQYYCQWLNLKFIPVPVSTWHAGLRFKTKQWKGRSKEISKLLASDIAKTKIEDDNIADAICIGWYWLNSLKNKEVK